MAVGGYLALHQGVGPKLLFYLVRFLYMRYTGRMLSSLHLPSAVFAGFPVHPLIALTDHNID